MKKRFFSIGLISALCLTSLFLFTGCESEPYGDYDLSEYVKVGDYKGLEYDKISVSVTDQEIEDEIQSRCEASATTKTVKKGTVKDGDTVNVSYEGRIDGETFDGGSSDSYDITIGTTSMIDGFTDGLIGEKVGSTVKLDLKFPDDYSNEDVAGKDVTFEVNIKSKQVQEVPEYNLDFVKKNSDYDSLEDYEKSVKEDLKAEKTETAESEVKSTLWQKIVESSEVKKYPEEKEELIETTMQSFKDAAEDNDIEWEDYLEQIGYTEKDLKKTVTEYAETKVFQEMLVYYIADKEGIEVTDDEYEEYMKNMLAESGLDEDTFKSTYNMTIEEYCEQQGLRSSMLLNKVMDKVLEYGKAVEKKK